MNDAELVKWLRENSSGVYRPAAEAADRIEELLAEIDRMKREEVRRAEGKRDC